MSSYGGLVGLHVVKCDQILLLLISACFSQNVPTEEVSCQCDQIGRLFKVRGNKFSFKSSPNTRWIDVRFCKWSFFIKHCCGTIWARFGEILATFYLTAGHTGLTAVDTICQKCILNVKSRDANFRSFLCQTSSAKYEALKVD